MLTSNQMNEATLSPKRTSMRRLMPLRKRDAPFLAMHSSGKADHLCHCEVDEALNAVDRQNLQDCYINQYLSLPPTI